VIHPSAQIHSGADIAEDVSVGAFSIIGEHVRIGRGTRIAANVIIEGHTISFILSLLSAARRRIRNMPAKKPVLK
jgi:NDP-sugar pyrophosphorylase family protein